MKMRYRNAEEAGKVESYLGIGPQEKSPGESGLSRIVELQTGKNFGRKSET